MMGDDTRKRMCVCVYTCIYIKNIYIYIYIYIYIHTHIYIYDWVTLLYNINLYNIVNQLYFNKKGKNY